MDGCRVDQTVGEGQPGFDGKGGQVKLGGPTSRGVDDRDWGASREGGTDTGGEGRSEPGCVIKGGNQGGVGH